MKDATGRNWLVEAVYRASRVIAGGFARSGRVWRQLGRVAQRRGVGKEGREEWWRGERRCVLVTALVVEVAVEVGSAGECDGRDVSGAAAAVHGRVSASDERGRRAGVWLGVEDGGMIRKAR